MLRGYSVPKESRDRWAWAARYGFRGCGVVEQWGSDGYGNGGALPGAEVGTAAPTPMGASAKGDEASKGLEGWGIRLGAVVAVTRTFCVLVILR